jgi:hypothetical protein
MTPQFCKKKSHVCSDTVGNRQHPDKTPQRTETKHICRPAVMTSSCTDKTQKLDMRVQPPKLKISRRTRMEPRPNKRKRRDPKEVENPRPLLKLQQPIRAQTLLVRGDIAIPASRVQLVDDRRVRRVRHGSADGGRAPVPERV